MSMLKLVGSPYETEVLMVPQIKKHNFPILKKRNMSILKLVGSPETGWFPRLKNTISPDYKTQFPQITKTT